jgi:hypothetical protein
VPTSAPGLTGCAHICAGTDRLCAHLRRDLAGKRLTRELRYGTVAWNVWTALTCAADLCRASMQLRCAAPRNAAQCNAAQRSAAQRSATQRNATRTIAAADFGARNLAGMRDGRPGGAKRSAGRGPQQKPLRVPNAMRHGPARPGMARC